MSYPFVKGHGTENDFVVVPADVDVTPERARALCDRRAGIGADGVIQGRREGERWVMDYRNSDGSLGQMCGNGIRVLARYLVEVEGVEPGTLEIDTRSGTRTLTFDGDLITVDMGRPEVLGETKVAVGDRSWPALHVSMGNPHAVAWVDDLAEAGSLLTAPDHDDDLFPDGVNVEFVRRVGDAHVEMRVHERGSGETRSCGTGACAVMVAAALEDGADRGTTYTVDVPGGRLAITWTEDDRVLMTGPAVLVARGETDL